MTGRLNGVVRFAGTVAWLVAVIDCGSDGSGAAPHPNSGTAGTGGLGGSDTGEAQQGGAGAGPDAGPCGDGVLDAGEACDDGNNNSGDGCSSTCNLEPGWSCTTLAAGKSTCIPTCGDGIAVGGEVCDDGNTIAGDGCSPSCVVEASWECHAAPSVCTALPPRVRTPPSLGAPMVGLPNSQWSYVEFPNTTCADGTPAGLLISPGSEDLLFFMEGGWSCDSCSDCAQTMTQTLVPPEPRGVLGSVDVTQRQSLLDYMNDTNNWNGSIFSRSDSNNVFKDFTFMYVMSCTGDFHGGDSVMTCTSDAQTSNIYFKGHANIAAFLDRVAATWPAPTRVVVAGASAGGYGTLFNYDTFRLYWPNQKMYLIDDSSPANLGFPSSADMTLWNVQAALGNTCPQCGSDLSNIYAALYRWYPNDRKVYLSHMTDPHAGGASLTPMLRSAASTIFEPNRWKWFYGGDGHTFIAGVPGNQSRSAMEMTTFVSARVSVQAFLQAQVDDDPSWSSVTPP